MWLQCNKMWKGGMNRFAWLLIGWCGFVYTWSFSSCTDMQITCWQTSLRLNQIHRCLVGAVETNLIKLFATRKPKTDSMFNQRSESHCCGYLHAHKELPVILGIIHVTILHSTCAPCMACSREQQLDVWGAWLQWFAPQLGQNLVNVTLIVKPVSSPLWQRTESCSLVLINSC